jgi:hypothetical protein
MVPGMAEMANEERQRKLDLPTLAFTRIRGYTIDMFKIFKYTNGIYKVECFIMLLLHETTSMLTRDHGFRLAKRDCHSQLTVNFFGWMVGNLQNSLPDEIVEVLSVNCLKVRFD